MYLKIIFYCTKAYRPFFLNFAYVNTEKAFDEDRNRVIPHNIRNSLLPCDQWMF